MKKTNLFTYMFLVLVIILSYLYAEKNDGAGSVNVGNRENLAAFNKEEINNKHLDIQIKEENIITGEVNNESKEDKGNEEITGNEIESESTGESENEETQKNEIVSNITPTLENTLFIGDSRTVGLFEYAQIEGADFFASEGMSVYNIYNKHVSMPDVGKVSLTELLDGKKYDKVFIMLGINEVGYEMMQTQKEYKGLVDLVRDKQKDATVFIQSNLHVTKSRSEGDEIINNNAINKLNSLLSELADGNWVRYIDANTFFDDESGNLSEDKSGDGVHLYAKYYCKWGDWIAEQVKIMSGRNSVD